jgi:hypothetical protein
MVLGCSFAVIVGRNRVVLSEALVRMQRALVG